MIDVIVRDIEERINQAALVKNTTVFPTVKSKSRKFAPSFGSNVLEGYRFGLDT